MQRKKELGGAHALLQLGTDDLKQGTKMEGDDLAHGGTSAEAALPEAKKAPLSISGDALHEMQVSELGRTVASYNRSVGEHALSTPGSKNNGNHAVDPDYLDKDHQLLNDAVEAAVMKYVGGTLDAGDALEGSASGENGLELLSKRRLNHDDLMSEYQWDKFLQDEVAAGFERTVPTKRSRRKNSLGTNEIDPELADLETTSEHDQLVQAAIMGAGELANQLSIPGSSRNRNGHVPMLQDSGSSTHTDDAEEHPGEDSPKHHSLKRRRESSVKLKRLLKKQPEAAVNVLPKSKYNHASIEELIEQASNEACMWYNIQADSQVGGPRLFSREEIDIVENFIQGYCVINNLTRDDICQRVWAADRPRDNFWECLSKVLPYRSRASVYKHIRRQYHVFEIRAKWTKAEDDLLKKLAEMASLNWKQIGAAMNRMPEDCRDRWRNYIKCGDNRAAHMWSEEEETSLRNIVMDMINKENISEKPIKINWTLVSEQMNGVRSRIQCRYKWNKLLKRESLARIAVMDSATKLWLLNKIAEMNAPDIEAIDWDYLVQMHHEKPKERNKILWTTGDFKIAFEKMKRTVREKNLSLDSLLSKLISNLHDDNNRKPQHEMLRAKPRNHEEEEAASVANAAVAAVSSGVTSQDAQPQEYSLWR